MKIKTIDINFYEWFDKINGNSYNAGYLTINFGMKTVEIIPFTFDYGYGDYYLQRVSEYLYKNAKKYKIESKNTSNVLYDLREKNNVIIRYNIQRNCLKKKLMEVQ